MAPISTFGILALATSVLAAPYTHPTAPRQYTHPFASGSVKSHHLPSGTKVSASASASAPTKSQPQSTVVEYHTVPVHPLPASNDQYAAASAASVISQEGLPTGMPDSHNAAAAGPAPGSEGHETCAPPVTVTTKVQVTVTVSAEDHTANTADSKATVADSHENGAPIKNTLTSASSKKHHGSSASASISKAKPSGHASESLASASTGTLANYFPGASALEQASTKSATFVPLEHEHTQASSAPVSLASAVDASSSSLKTVPTEGTTVAAAAVAASPSSSIPLTSSLTVEDKVHQPNLNLPSVVISAHPTTSAAVALPMTTAKTSTTQPDVASPSTTAQTSSTQAAAAAATSAGNTAVSGMNGAGSSYTGTDYHGVNKRGLVYNDASLLSGFEDVSKINWAWNWQATASGLPSQFKFIPTLWSTDNNHLPGWKDNAQKAIDAGASHIFSFNEPDNAGQANMDVATAAKAYKTYISDMFGGNEKVKLCSPAVTNGGGATGLNYLSSFLEQCKGCQIDCINVHWYGDDESDFEKHIAATVAVAGDREIWVSEFNLNGPPPAADIDTFLAQALPFLDGHSQVAGYSFFMVDKTIMLSSNAIGSTYKST